MSEVDENNLLNNYPSEKEEGEEDFLILNSKRVKRSSINEDVLILKEVVIQERLTESILQFQKYYVDNLCELIKH